METGTVKFYNEQKGYGFVSPVHGDVFVRYSDIEGVLGSGFFKKVSRSPTRWPSKGRACRLRTSPGPRR